MIALFLAAVLAIFCAVIFSNGRARRKRLVAEIEEAERKDKLWLEGLRCQTLLFQDNMRLPEEQRAKQVIPEPEPPKPHKTAGKKEFTLQNVVNALELSGLHVEHIDEIFPAVDPFSRLGEAMKAAEEPEITAIRLTVSPKGRFIRAKKIRRRHL